MKWLVRWNGSTVVEAECEDEAKEVGKNCVELSELEFEVSKFE